jgi:hypothetical protein
MIKRLKEIDPLSAAETFGFFFSFLGFLIGAIYSILLFFKVNPDVGFNFFYKLVKSLNLEYFSIIIFPLSYLVIGFILGAVLSALYNFSAELSKNGIGLGLED